MFRKRNRGGGTPTTVISEEVEEVYFFQPRTPDISQFHFAPAGNTLGAVPQSQTFSLAPNRCPVSVFNSEYSLPKIRSSGSPELVPLADG